MTQIFLARHGETQWNKEEVFRGLSDVPLNENGLRQADLLAGYLKTAKPEIVYSSPVRRAAQTAQIVANAAGIPMEVSPQLTDLDFGDWEGKPQAEFKDDPLLRQWLEHPERVRMPGGDGLADVRRRAVPFVAEIVKRYSGRVVMVTHRVVIKVLVCALLGLDDSHFWNIRSDTASVTVFSYGKRGFILDRHNENCYLLGCGGGLGDF